MSTGTSSRCYASTRRSSASRAESRRSRRSPMRSSIPSRPRFTSARRCRPRARGEPRRGHLPESRRRLPLARRRLDRTRQPDLRRAQFDRVGSFPGLREAQRLAVRDEVRHIGIGVSYARRRLARDGQAARALIDELVDGFHALGDTCSSTPPELADDFAEAYGAKPATLWAEVHHQLQLRSARSASAMRDATHQRGASSTRSSVRRRPGGLRRHSPSLVRLRRASQSSLQRSEVCKLRLQPLQRLYLQLAHPLEPALRLALKAEAGSTISRWPGSCARGAANLRPSDSARRRPNLRWTCDENGGENDDRPQDRNTRRMARRT